MTEDQMLELATRIERTCAVVIVHPADSHGVEVRKAQIDCLYDFEVRDLIAFLRLAAQSSPHGASHE